jgi:glutaredoxin
MADVTLYQAEWCPYSHRVRHMLCVHGVRYLCVNVPEPQDQREELEQISGQRSIPTLVIDGHAYTSGSEIAQVIAEKFPANAERIAAHERKSAPTVAARLDTGNIDELAELLSESFAQSGFTLAPARALPGEERRFALENAELYERLTNLEPRLRTELPVYIVLYSHPNGAVALAPLVGQHWMHYRDRGVFKEAHQLDEVIQAAVERVGNRAGVA